MAQYPTAAGTDANLFIAVNGLATTLSDNPLTIGATTVNVASTTGFPTAGYITIEAEAIAYTGVTGTSFTGCTRGADGTTAASHVTGLAVQQDVVAAHHNVLKDEVKAIEGDLVSARGNITSGGSTLATAMTAVQSQITTAQTTATAALPKTGGTMSGALTITEINTASGAQISSNMSVAGISFLNNQANSTLTIQGFATGSAGQIIVFTNNTGGNQVTFVHQGSGTVKFTLPNSQNLVLGTREGAVFAYDGSAAASWFCVGRVSANGQVLGTATNDNAAAGNVGERVSSAVSSVAGGASAAFSNITSISLTAGDWDLHGVWVANNTVVTPTGNAAGYISAFTGNTNTDAAIGDNQWYGGIGAVNGSQYNSWAVSAWRVSITTTTTYYLKGMQTYSSGTPSWNGRLTARRMR